VVNTPFDRLIEGCTYDVNSRMIIRILIIVFILGFIIWFVNNCLLGNNITLAKVVAITLVATSTVYLCLSYFLEG
jgi:hypothetical protein